MSLRCHQAQRDRDSAFRCYDFELERVARVASELKAKRLLVQLPDGLKPAAPRLVDELASLIRRHGIGDAEIILVGEPSFGACDLPLEHLRSLKPDLLVHVGHSRYPDVLANAGATTGFSNVVYVPARYRWKPSEELLNDLARLLRELGVRRVGLAATVQHTHVLADVRRGLRVRGLETLVSRPFYAWGEEGQVLGCEYSAAKAIRRNVDAFVIVCGGTFHPLGLGMSTLKPVIKLDPYEERAVDVTSHVFKYLKVRYFKLLEAKEARCWGVLMGVKSGQYRPWLVRALIKLISSKGAVYRLYSTSLLTKEVLANIDSGSDAEAYVVTSCPRIAVDDVSDFHKPVLTPGEALMALTGRMQHYVFPW